MGGGHRARGAGRIVQECACVCVYVCMCVMCVMSVCLYVTVCVCEITLHPSATVEATAAYVSFSCSSRLCLVQSGGEWPGAGMGHGQGGQ